MLKLAPIAAVLIAGAGALAQDCCEKTSTEATAQTVAQTTQPECCSTQKAQAVVQTAAMTTTDDECAKACEEACETTCDEKALEPAGSGSRFGASFPQMSFVIGKETTSCPEQAAALAAAGSAPVMYQVAGKTYECEQEAGVAYSAQLNEYLESVTRISFVVGEECVGCPIAAQQLSEKKGECLKYRVGNSVFSDPAAAIRASAMAYGATRQVALATKVNGEKTSCAETIAMAKSCSETKLAYCVGDKETTCEVEASCLLAMAKIEAAMAAAEKVAADQG